MKINMGDFIMSMPSDMTFRRPLAFWLWAFLLFCILVSLIQTNYLLYRFNSAVVHVLSDQVVLTEKVLDYNARLDALERENMVIMKILRTSNAVEGGGVVPAPSKPVKDVPIGDSVEDLFRD